MMTCDMTVEPSSLVNTHRKAADGSKPWLQSEMAKKCRVQWGTTLPLIATSAPPEARVVDGVTDDQEGSISSGNPGDKSRDESETTTVAAPPGPIQVAQLIQREKKEMRRELAAETHEHTIMVEDRGVVLGQAADTPPGAAMAQAYSRLTLNPLPNTVTRREVAGMDEG
jgi:hypothetical protein